MVTTMLVLLELVAVPAVIMVVVHLIEVWLENHQILEVAMPPINQSVPSRDNPPIQQALSWADSRGRNACWLA